MQNLDSIIQGQFLKTGVTRNGFFIRKGYFNPIQAGGGHNVPPPTGFFLAVLKRLAVG